MLALFYTNCVWFKYGKRLAEENWCLCSLKSWFYTLIRLNFHFVHSAWLHTDLRRFLKSGRGCWWLFFSILYSHLDFCSSNILNMSNHRNTWYIWHLGTAISQYLHCDNLHCDRLEHLLLPAPAKSICLSFLWLQHMWSFYGELPHQNRL